MGGVRGTYNESNYEKIGEGTKYGVTGKQTAAAANVYDGFTQAGVTQKEIAADGSTVVDIYYNRNTYALSLNANGGTIGISSQDFVYNTPAAIKTATSLSLSRTGYTFAGWAESADGSVVYSDGASYTIGAAAATLYAKWDAASNTAYKVRHWQQKTSGAKAVYNDSNYSVYETDNLSGVTGGQTAAAVKTYSGFTDAPFTQKEIAADGTTIVDVYYNRNSYELNFNANGGTIVTPSQDFYYKVPAAIKTASALTLAKTGHTFAGWAESATGNVLYSDGGSYTIDAAAATLYAKWNANTYTVTFNANGGTLAVSSQGFVYDTATAIKTAAALSLTRTGYTFAGWATSETGDVVYSDGDSYTIGAANVTLYARWNAATTTVYKARHWQQKVGGSLGLYNETNYSIQETENLSGTTGNQTAAAAKTYSGFSNADITQKTIAADGSTIVDIYYNRNQYTLSFETNGGTIVTPSQNFYYGVPTAIKTASALNLTKTGYTFAGWATSSTESVVYSDGGNYTIGAADASLTAKWNANTYTVKFNSNGGSGSMANQSFTYDAAAMALPANTFTKSGCSFVCWMDDAGNTYTNQEAVQNLTAAANGVVTLTAQWQDTGAIEVVITPGTSGSTVTLNYTRSGNTVSFTAGGGYTTYEWYVDSVRKSSGTSSTYTLNTSGYTAGTTVQIMVRATNSSGAEASNSAQVTVPRT